jgi:hypothetical protein
MTLEQLKEEEERLYNLLKINHEKQKEIKTKYFVEKNGANIGDVIQWEENKNIKIAKIVEIEYTGVTPDCYMVSYFNKDGSLSKNKNRLGFWLSENIKVITKDTGHI